MTNLDDVIAAIATPPAGALRGVVRVSGPGAILVVKRMLAAECDPGTLEKLTRPVVVSSKLRLEGTAVGLPCDLFVWPGQRSYTRQQTVEIHTIGSPPLLDAVLRSACAAGARLAQPGEFTLRAFLAGRLDLAQAEAVLGVIEATNDRQLDTALAQLAGGLSGPLSKLREDLLELLAHLEAGLDFVEEDIEFVTKGEVQSRLASAESQLAAIQQQVQGRGLRGQPFRAVLLGPPNAGKSSLFNALTRSNNHTSGAIVSPTPGTTRDALIAPLPGDGPPCELVDTAGLGDQSLDEIDAAAQHVSTRQAAEGDLEIWCVDASAESAKASPPNDCKEERIVAFTKIDAAANAVLSAGGIATSSQSGEGVAQLAAEIRRRAVARDCRAGIVAATAVRCEVSVRLATDSLARARHLAATQAGDELIAAELRVALEALGHVVGAIYTDDILDRIFSRFCIGK